MVSIFARFCSVVSSFVLSTTSTASIVSCTTTRGADCAAAAGASAPANANAPAASAPSVTSRCSARLLRIGVERSHIVEILIAPLGLRLLIGHLGLPALDVGVAHGGVEVESVLALLADRLEQPRALVDDAHGRQRGARIPRYPPGVAVQAGIDDQPSGIARARGSEQRQYQIGPRRHAPDAERLA